MGNLNAEEIKKVLEHCANWTAETGCKGCPYDGNCIDKDVMKDALALIKSQEQRIKELTEENERLSQSLANSKSILANSKADTVRQMQEELKKTFSALCKGEMGDLYRIIDQIAKEMLEGETK